jgi:hypothetical protein
LTVRFALDGGEAIAELPVGTLQRFLGVDVEMTREIGDGEDQVAELILDPVRPAPAFR